MKMIQLTTAKAVYHLPLEFIAKARAEYYKDSDDTTIEEEIGYVMEDPSMAFDWMSNNMDVEDYESAMVKVRDVEIEEDFNNAEKDIVEV